mmetsp:Transcript_92991/g.165368  ORF Transcript_92991/g.165368 Transcript_92991/m.165368 type:complete len:692 (+) Transcript_92991:39-2114(+)|eukprot:CAMPEP_0197654246 /NCGR_PEP_ID=MMETSP1338-20131121/38734_1 /TAXON_ID=43686 ORGANISM="Pelagodinium beii, Strain RCC1491" /NCGR_SAMPLE_ID=MMETSP1338 /ASSEMBLY_ACC=CAM_ASM_000754 /LENGTH=691 /DNA_ID=CAMNT_0043229655 /DNA_START=34 /DNA_END=2109 /DNA_ORIENTATION=-
MAEVGDGLAVSALDDVTEKISAVIERAEWLLDAESADAKSAAEGARSFVKLFFDACQAHSPLAVQEASSGLNNLVVDGFDREQIWEEMEVQNVPLRRHLRRHVPKLASSAKGAIDLSFSGSSPAKGSTARISLEEEDADDDFEDEAAKPVTKPKKGGQAKKAEAKAGKKAAKAANGKEEAAKETEGGQAKDFFQLDEMMKFADAADKMRLDEDAGDSDFDLLEAADDGDDEEAANIKFDDFFGAADQMTAGKASKSRDEDDLDEGEEEEDAALEGEEEEGLDDDLEELSDEEKELEAKIRALQAKGEEDEDEKEGDEDDEDGEITGEEDEEEGERPSSKGKSLYEMDRNLQSLEAEVEKLEEEQLNEKSWEMKGEVSSRQRPLNSLLESTLDQPMTSFAARRSEDATAGGDDDGDEALEDAPGADDLVKKSGFDVDAMIKQRIWDETFDDVVRKAELPPSQRPQGAEEDAVETLNFEKSRIGLGDVYAKQYEAELLGHTTDAEKKDDKEKAEAKKLFAKLMYKLDMLSNAHFTPRPPVLGGSADSKVASLKMEETIPLMVSDATLQAPEELKKARKHVKDHAELSHDEKTAVRRAKKAKRKKSLLDKVESGSMSLADRREREKKLKEKNMAAKQEKANVGQVKDAKKRLKASELLSQAASNARSDVSRKDEVRKQRDARPDNTPASKRLKL